MYRTDVVPTTQRGNCSCAIKENPFRIFQFPRVTSALHCFIYSFIIISIIFLDPGLLALPSLGRFNKKYTRTRTRTDTHLKDGFCFAAIYRKQPESVYFPSRGDIGSLHLFGTPPILLTYIFTPLWPLIIAVTYSQSTPPPFLLHNDNGLPSVDVHFVSARRKQLGTH